MFGALIDHGCRVEISSDRGLLLTHVRGKCRWDDVQEIQIICPNVSFPSVLFMLISYGEQPPVVELCRNHIKQRLCRLVNTDNLCRCHLSHVDSLRLAILHFLLAGVGAVVESLSIFHELRKDAPLAHASLLSRDRILVLSIMLKLAFLASPALGPLPHMS